MLTMPIVILQYQIYQIVILNIPNRHADHANRHTSSHADHANGHTNRHASLHTSGHTNRHVNRPPALYRLTRKTHTSTRKNGPRMGFFIFVEAHTGPLQGFLP